MELIGMSEPTPMLILISHTRLIVKKELCTLIDNKGDKKVLTETISDNYYSKDELKKGITITYTKRNQLKTI